MERLFRVSRHLSTSAPNRKVKVAVLGAAGGIGQPLSLLLKIHPLVSELSLYDVVNTPGVGADLSHIDTKVKITAHVRDPELEPGIPDPELGAALKDCQLVIIPAGVPRKPGMTRDDLFRINAGIVETLCEAVAEHCKEAWVAIISNPVNSTVAIAAEVFKKRGCYEPKRLFGVTTLDIVRAKTFIGEILEIDPKEVKVPVVGGHAGITILPLLSQADPPLTDLSPEKLAALTVRIQNAGTEVVNAKAGAGSATLSMAYAAAEFGGSCLKAMNGEDQIIECSFVASNLTDLPFFASPVKLGKSGIEEFLPLGKMSEAEEQNLEKLKPELQASIQKGIDFVTKT